MADVYYRATVRSSDGIFSEKNKERKEREICEATRERERERYVESEVYITEVYIHSSRSETRRRREGGFSIRRWKRNNT